MPSKPALEHKIKVLKTMLKQMGHEHYQSKAMKEELKKLEDQLNPERNSLTFPKLIHPK